MQIKESPGFSLPGASSSAHHKLVTRLRDHSPRRSHCIPKHKSPTLLSKKCRSLFKKMQSVPSILNANVSDPETNEQLGCCRCANARLKWAFEALSCRLLKGSERKLAPMTVSSPNLIEIKLDRLIDDMRLLRSQMIAFDKRLKEIEAYLKPNEQQPESKSRPWFAAAASATARTVLILFAVGAATGAALHYLGT
jgi:hypothetical protein